jgi:hypothetical protein
MSDKCDLCYSGLVTTDGTILPSNPVGNFAVCKNCYDKEVMRMAKEPGMREQLNDRLDYMIRTKRWEKLLL